MLKNAIVRVVASMLVALLAVGETSADEGSAPINPAFLKWRKNRKRKSVKPVSDGQKSRKLLASAPQTAEGELGLAPSVFDSSYLANLNISRVRGVGASYPSRYDLREQGWLTPIRNQNPYGTCWTFATFSSMESSLLKFEGQAFDFSENNLANLHGGDWGYDDGGNADLASAYLLRWDGPVLESVDAYPNPGGSRTLTPVRHVQNVPWIAGKSTYLDNDGIKDAIMKYGALWVGYYHDNSCYNASKSSYYFPYFIDGYRLSNHAVAVVGWDDNYSRYNFIDTPRGNGAYIVRNNWGSYWGDGGYFYVSYFDETFAWNTLYSFSNVEAVDNYSAIYQYDPLGMISALGYKNSSSAWGANMFKATTSDPISAVGFYAMAPRTAYKIFIYTGCTTGSPCSGTLKLTQSGTSETAGYLTVPLSQSVGITKDVMFSVVLQLTTSGYNYPLAFEYAVDDYSSGATASRGQSYLSSGGEVWTDFADTQYPYANFCCKAYAKAKTAPVKVLASIGVEGVSSLTAGKSAQFTCKTKYSDGSETDVTDKTTWSIADGRLYASVSSSGLVTAKEVDAQQTVKVHAKYTEGSVTKENDWSFYVTVAAPQPPTGLTATEGTDASCIRVNWTAPSGASSYAVYRSASSSSGSAKFLEPVTITRYADTDESLVPGVDYWYFIKAKNDSGTSGYSEGVRGWRKLSAPENVSATDGTSLDNVTITWSEVKGAKYYRVYRSAEDETEAEAKPLGTGWQTATKYVDSTAQAGVTYLYYVKAAINGNGDRPSEFGIFDDGFRSVPVTLDSISIDGAASIVAGGSATYTCTATYTDKSTKLVSPTWEIVGGSQFVTRSGATLTAKPVTGNQVVTLKATYTDGVKRTANKSITITAVKPSAPKTVTLKGATTEGVSISWTSVSGASAYSVWRGTSTANAKKIADALTGTEYTDVSGEPGVAYTYWVKASNAAGESAFSTGSVTGTRLLSAPTGVVASDGTFTDKTTVTWKAVPGATHYRVARAESQTGTKTELGSWQTVVSYSDANGTVGKRYWYFVKAATSSAGANASAYGAGDEGWRKVSVSLSSIAIGGVAKLAAGASTVFSCSATYSDGTSRTVTPTWSASGSGTIDASGKFTAAAVTADSTATVTARYTDGTSKTATHEVKIVVPVKATAEIASVKPSTRWPFSGKLDVDYELKTTPEGTRALVSLSGFDNDKQTPMAAKTLSGDGAEGAVAAGKHRLTWDVAADYPNFHAKSFGVEMTAVPMTIAAPSNLAATAGTSAAAVELSWSVVDEATGYEVWRGTSSATDSAQRIGTVTSVTYADATASAGVTYYYWVRSVGEDGISDFGKAVSGSRAYADITVTFNPNGGSVSPTSKTYSPTKTYGSLPTPTRTGYGFDGWYTSSGGGAKVTTSSAVPTSAHTLWAHWTANTYTIRFNANGGSGSMNDLAMTYDVAKNLTATAFVKAGYDFKGWATSAGGAVAYTDGCSVANLTSSNGATVTLFAVWETQVMVQFNANGGSGAMESLMAGNGAPFVVPECKFYRNGYVFAGWAKTSSGGVIYTPGDIACAISGLTLHAKWALPSKTYLVIDLSAGPDAEGYPMSELTTVPVGGWTDEYKTNKLVMRRIANGSFMMGSEPTEVGAKIPGSPYIYNDAKPHQVTISKPFYMGVFEVTQKQYKLMTGYNGNVTSGQKGDARPAPAVSYEQIRGTSEGAKWPSDSTVDATSIMGKIRARTGLTFDLPTEAQWEYACRAGTTTALNNGKNLTNPSQDSAMDEVGSYHYNGRELKIVGSYLPNSWGLYDMHGNVKEWCLDIYAMRETSGFDLGAMVDPKGVGETPEDWYRVVRGGDLNDAAGDCRSASRRGEGPFASVHGFRLCCPAEN